MFGKPPPRPAPAQPARPAAADTARIAGGGLVQVIVTSVDPITYYLFLNDQAVSQIDIESLSVALDAPNDGITHPTVRATLARYANTVTGGKTEQRTELFPCTLEIVALGRRVSVTCMRPDSLEGAWINLGLRADGTSDEVQDARSLTILLSNDILSATLARQDGTTEDLLPQ